MNEIKGKFKIITILLIIIFLYSVTLVILPVTQISNLAIASSSWTLTSESDFSNGTLDNITIVAGELETELKLELGWINQNSSWPVPLLLYSPKISARQESPCILAFKHLLRKMEMAITRIGKILGT